MNEKQEQAASILNHSMITQFMHNSKLEHSFTSTSVALSNLNERQLFCNQYLQSDDNFYSQTRLLCALHFLPPIPYERNGAYNVNAHMEC